MNVMGSFQQPTRPLSHCQLTAVYPCSLEINSHRLEHEHEAGRHEIHHACLSTSYEQVSQSEMTGF